MNVTSNEAERPDRRSGCGEATPQAAGGKRRGGSPSPPANSGRDKASIALISARRSVRTSCHCETVLADMHCAPMAVARQAAKLDPRGKS